MKLGWPFSKKDAGEKKKKRKGPKTVNIFLGFFFMVNYCLGTGFLGVPFSFFYAGYLASIPTLLVIAFVSWNGAEWIVETMSRAQVDLLRYTCIKDIHVLYMYIMCTKCFYKILGPNYYYSRIYTSTDSKTCTAILYIE